MKRDPFDGERGPEVSPNSRTKAPLSNEEREELSRLRERVASLESILGQVRQLVVTTPAT